MDKFREKMQEVADSIRGKTGETEQIEVNNFPNEINTIKVGLPEGVRAINLKAEPENGGTVSGGGYASDDMVITITAKGDESNYYYFKAWKENDKNISTDADYTFKISDNRELISVFERILPKYNVTVSIEPTEGGTVTGDGTYELGSVVTLTASANDGYQFKAWKDGENVVSTENTYSFEVENDKDLVALYEVLREYIAGLDWVRGEDLPAETFGQIVVGSDRFIAPVKDGSFYVSTDGVNWIKKAGYNTQYWKFGTYNQEGTFYFFTNSGSGYISTTDGETWTRNANGTSRSGTSCVFAYYEKIFIIDTGRISSGKKIFKLHISTDYGQKWTTLDLPGVTNTGAPECSHIIYNGRLGVITLNNTTTAFYSTNVTSTWNTTNNRLSSSGNVKNIIQGYNENSSRAFFTVTENGYVEEYDETGNTWKTRALTGGPSRAKPTSPLLYTYKNFIVLSAPSTIWQSTDGATWEAKTTDTTIPKTFNVAVRADKVYTALVSNTTGEGNSEAYFSKGSN